MKTARKAPTRGAPASAATRALAGLGALTLALAFGVALTTSRPKPVAAPETAASLVVQAELAAELGDPERALAWLAVARPLGYRDAQTAVRSASLSLKLADLAGTKEDVALLEGLVPGSVDALVLRGCLAEHEDNAGAAHGLLIEATRLAPGRTDTCLALARLAYAKHDRDDAQRWLEEARRRAPGDGSTALAAARLLRANGDASRAEECFRVATSDPRVANEAKLALGELLLEREAYQEAADLLRSAAGAKDPVALATRARIALRLGDLEGARPLALEASVLSPQAPDVVKTLAALARADGDMERAVAGFERVLKTCPGDVEAHESLAALYAERGVLELAERHAIAATKARPDLPGPQVALSRVERWAGRLGEAESSARRALERTPDHTGGRAALAAALVARGVDQLDGLRGLVRDEAQLDPAATLDLASALRAVGQRAEARLVLDSALARCRDAFERERLLRAIGDA